MNKRIFSIVLLVVLAPFAVVAQEAPDLDAAFEAMRTHTFEAGGNPGQPITDAIMAAHGDTEARTALAGKLVGLLDADTTFPAKRFACQHLYIIGTAAQVPALAPMLTDPELAHLACYALQTIPGPEADQALLDALGKTEGKVRINIVNVLGKRATASALQPLADLLPGDSPETQRALLQAISSIGLANDRGVTLQAAEVIAGPHAPAMDQARVFDAALPLVAALVDSGWEDGLEKILHLYSIAETKAAKTAVLDAWVRTFPKEALPEVATLLASDDMEWAALACGYVRTMEVDGATEVFLDALNGNLQPENETILITALVDRGDPAARPAVLAALDSEQEAVRIAAVKGLGAFGDATSAVPLAEAAASASGEMPRVARESLYRVPDPAADVALAAALNSAAAPVQEEIIRALGARGAQDAFPQLLAKATAGDEKVRKAAIDALGQLGQHAQLPQLLALLPQVEAGSLRNALTRAIVDLARKADTPETRATALHEMLAGNADKAVRETLLEQLGGIGDPTSLEVLDEAAKSDDADIRLAAVKGLGDWQDDSPMITLANLAEKDSDRKVSAEALNGYIRLLREREHENKDALTGHYEKALDLARSKSDQRRIFAGLSELRDRAALDLVNRYLDDEELRGEAAVAAERIRSNFYVLSASADSDNAKYAMDGNIDSRWTTNAVMQGGEWFLIDMTESAPVAGIVLDNSRSTGDYPRGYRVYVFDDPANPGAPVAEGEGTSPVTEIRFTPTTGRYVKIEQTGKADNLWWSIDEMRLIAQ